VVGVRAVPVKIPIGRAGEAGHVTVKEEKVGAARMQVGVGEIRGTHAGKILGIEKPDEAGGIGDSRESDRPLGGAGAIDVLIQAVVKQIVSVASSAIAGAEPERAGDGSGGVGTPGLIVIAGGLDLSGQLDVPALVGVEIGRVGETLGRKAVVVVVRVKSGGKSPLTEVMATDQGAGEADGAAGGGEDQGGENGENEEDGEQLDDGEGAGCRVEASGTGTGAWGDGHGTSMDGCGWPSQAWCGCDMSGRRCQPEKNPRHIAVAGIVGVEILAAYRLLPRGMNDWNIQARARVCRSCGHAFADKDPYHTVLSEQRSGFERVDICAACWESQHRHGSADRKGFISHWQGLFVVPPPPPPEAIQKDSAESLLRRLVGLQDPAWHPAAYILAVMLERKRVLKIREQILQEGRRIFVYELPRSGEVFTIRDPDLKLDQLAEVQRDVARLLEVGLPVEASPTEEPFVPEVAPSAKVLSSSDTEVWVEVALAEPLVEPAAEWVAVAAVDTAEAEAKAGVEAEVAAEAGAEPLKSTPPAFP